MNRPAADRRPLLVFGDDWGRRVSTLQHIVTRLIGTRPIAWVNGINHRAPRLNAYDVRRAAEKVGAMLRPSSAPAARSEVVDRRPSPDVVIPPRVIPWHQVPLFQRINARWLGRDIRRATAELFAGIDPIIVASTPVAAYATPRIPHQAVVYFCLDEYAAMDGVDPDIVRPAERRMLELADLTLVTASTMLESKRPRSGAVQHLPQGVNFAHFAAEGSVDPAVASLPRPILGFSGTIEPRVDLALLSHLATEFSTGSIVLVGEPRMSIGSLANRSNVHVLPRREYRDLPAVLRGFDVGLIPYALSDWTRAVDPLKLLEYLSAGLPVVSTPLPEVLRHGAIIHVSDESPSGFAAATHNALATQVSRKYRQQYAEQHSWETRALDFRRLLATLPAVT